MSQKTMEKQNPISRYNLVVKQYNDPVNRQASALLELAHNDCLYKKWFRIQSNYWVLLLFVYLLPYVNVFTLICNVFLVAIHEIALRTFRRNQKNVENPLKHMVYEPSFCNKNRRSFVYFEIKTEDLKTFKLDKHTEQQIMKRNEDFDRNTVRFMAFNNEFIAGYYSLVEYRVKALFYLGFNAIVVIFMQYFIYYPIFCLSLMNPLDSLSQCSTRLHLIS